MQKQELINLLAALSKEFAFERNDAIEKRNKLNEYISSISDREFDLQKHRSKIRTELDLDMLKKLKAEQVEKEKELNEVNFIIENLTDYNSKHQTRLSAIKEKYDRAEKELYLLIAEECKEKALKLCNENDSLIQLMKDFIVANANALNGGPRYEYGAVFTDILGRFGGDEYKEHKATTRQQLGIPDLES